MSITRKITSKLEIKSTTLISTLLSVLKFLGAFPFKWKLLAIEDYENETKTKFYKKFSFKVNIIYPIICLVVHLVLVIFSLYSEFLLLQTKLGSGYGTTTNFTYFTTFFQAYTFPIGNMVIIICETKSFLKMLESSFNIIISWNNKILNPFSDVKIIIIYLDLIFFYVVYIRLIILYSTLFNSNGLFNFIPGIYLLIVSIIRMINVFIFHYLSVSLGHLWSLNITPEEWKDVVLLEQDEESKNLKFLINKSKNDNENLTLSEEKLDNLIFMALELNRNQVLVNKSYSAFISFLLYDQLIWIVLSTFRMSNIMADFQRHTYDLGMFILTIMIILICCDSSTISNQWVRFFFNFFIIINFLDFVKFSICTFTAI